MDIKSNKINFSLFHIDIRSLNRNSNYIGNEQLESYVFCDCNVSMYTITQRVVVFLVIEASPSESCSSRITERTEASGAIVSPGFVSGNYPNNAICKWRIRVKDNMVNDYACFLSPFRCLIIIIIIIIITTCFLLRAPLGLEQEVWWSSTDCHRFHLETFGIQMCQFFWHKSTKVLLLSSPTWRRYAWWVWGGRSFGP